ncbi:MAG TPA: hypothetical protein VLV50_20380 [Stellaceae bacterium]|nr:hypothetical protein [Stellaceae bacterium]
MFGLKPRSETGMTVDEYVSARRLAMRWKARWALYQFCLCFLAFSFLFLIGAVAMGFLHRFGFGRAAIWWAIMEGAAAWSALLVAGANFLFKAPPPKVNPNP